MTLHRLGTGRISRRFMALLKLAMMDIFTAKLLSKIFTSVLSIYLRNKIIL